MAFQQVVNTDYEGELSMGNSVKINEIGPVTVQDYTRNSTSDITWEYLSDAQKELKIDQAKYFAVAIDDIDKVQAKGPIVEGTMDEAAYAIRNTVDQYIASLYGEAGMALGASSAISVSDGNILRILGRVKQEFMNKGWSGPIWCVAPPWLFQKVTAKAITEQTDNMRAFEDGMVTTVHGITLLASNNVSGDTNTTSDTNKVMFGSRRAISFAGQIESVEATRPSKAFHDLMKGLYVYGAKVVRPNELLTLYASWVDQTTST
jgi:hypothetical protein